jgi:hypothetical protein
VSGRLASAKKRTPAMLAKHITADIAAAGAWWQCLSAAERQGYQRGEREPQIPTQSRQASP